MIKKILGLLLGVLYSVSSNTFFHVSSMGHFFPFGEHGEHLVHSGMYQEPCHDGVDTQSPQTDDCFDHCMGVYDDFGGAGGVQVCNDGAIDSMLFLQGGLTFVDFGASQNTISWSIIDPPDNAGGGRSEVGKDRKKSE